MTDSIAGKRISELKVSELRTQLGNKGLDITGVKATLVNRLEKALTDEGINVNDFRFHEEMETSTTSATTPKKTGEAAATTPPVAEVVPTVTAAEKAAGSNNKDQNISGDGATDSKPVTVDGKVEKNNSTSTDGKEPPTAPVEEEKNADVTEDDDSLMIYEEAPDTYSNQSAPEVLELIEDVDDQHSQENLDSTDCAGDKSVEQNAAETNGEVAVAAAVSETQNDFDDIYVIENDEIDQDELNGDSGDLLTTGEGGGQEKKDNSTLKVASAVTIHDISDAEDVEEEEAIHASANAAAAGDSTTKENNDVDNKSKMALDSAASTTDGRNPNTASGDEKPTTTEGTKKAATTVVPKLPANLPFPKDDPKGERCLWISGLPYATRRSDIEVTFRNAGFKGDAKIYLSKQSTTAFAFMVLDSEKFAIEAVKIMHKSIFRGKTIGVEVASQASVLQNDFQAKTTTPGSTKSGGSTTTTTTGTNSTPAGKATGPGGSGPSKQNQAASSNSNNGQSNTSNNSNTPSASKKRAHPPIQAPAKKPPIKAPRPSPPGPTPRPTRGTSHPNTRSGGGGPPPVSARSSTSRVPVSSYGHGPPHGPVHDVPYVQVVRSARVVRQSRGDVVSSRSYAYPSPRGGRGHSPPPHHPPHHRPSRGGGGGGRRGGHRSPHSPSYYRSPSSSSRRVHHPSPPPPPSSSSSRRDRDRDLLLTIDRHHHRRPSPSPPPRKRPVHDESYEDLKRKMARLEEENRQRAAEAERQRLIAINAQLEKEKLELELKLKTTLDSRPPAQAAMMSDERGSRDARDRYRPQPPAPRRSSPPRYDSRSSRRSPPPLPQAAVSASSRAPPPGSRSRGSPPPREQQRRRSSRSRSPMPPPMPPRDLRSARPVRNGPSSRSLGTGRSLLGAGDASARSRLEREPERGHERYPSPPPPHSGGGGGGGGRPPRSSRGRAPASPRGYMSPVRHYDRPSEHRDDRRSERIPSKSGKATDGPTPSRRSGGGGGGGNQPSSRDLRSDASRSNLSDPFANYAGSAIAQQSYPTPAYAAPMTSTSGYRMQPQQPSFNNTQQQQQQSSRSAMSGMAPVWPNSAQAYVQPNGSWSQQQAPSMMGLSVYDPSRPQSSFRGF